LGTESAAISLVLGCSGGSKFEPIPSLPGMASCNSASSPMSIVVFLVTGVNSYDLRNTNPPTPLLPPLVPLAAAARIANPGLEVVVGVVSIEAIRLGEASITDGLE